jgi:hypothetical protein
MMQRYGLGLMGASHRASHLDENTINNIDMEGLLLSTGAIQPSTGNGANSRSQTQQSNKRSSDSFESMTDTPNKRLTMSSDVSIQGANNDFTTQDESLFV